MEHKDTVLEEEIVKDDAQEEVVENEETTEESQENVVDIEDKLEENLRAIVNEIVKNKPTAVKGTFVKNISVSTTMSPGLKVDKASLGL